jgi:hypothetical protein
MNSDKITISEDALVHASKLRNNNLQKRNLKEVITDVLRQVSHELVIAHREGRHDIITSMPITFSISNMSNADAQRVIYASVIEALITKDFRVWINPSKDNCQLKITWMSPDDEAEMKHQMQIIARHTTNKI